ncbi:HAD family hydrolase [Gimesia sp.]|uniref:HAD family hydrolase n=1 Tax=Gimesia sp. TaxID=2024833 RepID=UPI003A8CFF16
MQPHDQILLILDIDETLLYAADRPLDRRPDCQIGPYAVYLRPYLTDFLNQVSQHYRIAVWSSSSPDYVDAVVDTIFPKWIELKFSWSRERCINRYDPELHEQYYIKDLKKVRRQGYHLERVLIVDDTPRKVERNYGNAIYVTPWFGDQNDHELQLLTKYLLQIRDQANLRRIEKRNWKSRSKL